MSSNLTEIIFKPLGIGKPMKNEAEVHITGRRLQDLIMMVSLRSGANDLTTYIQTEFCYNIKYITRNNRTQGDPWSLRQTGIYEKYDVDTGRSTWIVLSPSDRAYRLLQRSHTMTQPDSRDSGIPVMSLHAALLNASAHEWGQYLEDIRNEIQRLVVALIKIYKESSL